MNIGFYLLDVHQSNEKHRQILNGINDLCEQRPYDNIVLFNNQFHASDPDHKYYILHISEAKYFKGLLFVFDIKSAMLTKTFPAPRKQILFLDKAEWSGKRDMPYSFWNGIYNNEDFELVSTNKDLETLCDICWKKPLDNIDTFNGESINNVLQKL